MSSQKKIVVVGGGLGGYHVAHALQHLAEVTLVDPKDFFEVPMAAPRLIVAPGSLPAQVHYDEFLPKVTRIKGWLSEVTPTAIRVDQAGASDYIPYDYLVLATGSNYKGDLMKPHGGSLDDRVAHYQALNQSVEGAQNILIIGGGPVGVELAGEITESYPDKKITLVDGGKHILPLAAPRLRAWATEHLTQRGVDIQLSTRITEPAAPPAGDFAATSGQITTQAGGTIAYDIAFWCVGTRHDSAYMAAQMSTVLDEHGQIKVTPTLQVSGHPHIFALGDVSDLAQKGGLWVQFQSKVVIANLKRLLATPHTAKLKKYKLPFAPTTTVITLGKNHGVLELPVGQYRAGWMSRMLKGKHMLVDKYRGKVGV
jgi:NADH dehydrogenase FAD-containing subunit